MIHGSVVKQKEMTDFSQKEKKGQAIIQI